MTATGHAVIGTVIAAKIGNPALAIPIALVSHLLADAVPHWDVGTHGRKKTQTRMITESFVDVMIGFLLSYVLIVLLFPWTNLVYAFVIIIAAQAVDWLHTPYYILHINHPPFTWAYRLNKIFDHKLDKPWGVITQFVSLTLLVIFAKLI